MEVVYNYPFKLGLDLHGVIDKCPEKFIFLSMAIRGMGGTVIICTGSRNDQKLTDQLKGYCDGYKWWDSIFSITDYLIQSGVKYTENSDGGVTVEDPITWDRVKGDWARENNISLHIDDSPGYAQYFPSDIYLKFNERTERSRNNVTKLELVPDILG